MVVGKVFLDAIKEKTDPAATSLFYAGTKLLNFAFSQDFELLLPPP
jgi:hypothetical protein